MGYNSKTYTVNGVSFEMIPVEGGTFTMGCTLEQCRNAEDVEWPLHKVTLSSYAIGKTEVTQALWTAVMGNNPSCHKGANRPVESVSWNDCQEFIRRLNSLTGCNFRLPTEAEWEYAARGGNRSKGFNYAGSYILDEVAWYTDNSNDHTHDVATKKPNELGLYDMSGNVWEWCNDWFDDYTSTNQINPKGPTSGYRRVYRGGAWLAFSWRCRVSNRNCFEPDEVYDDLGLRLASDL